MSEAATPAVTAGGRVSTARFVGVIAIAYAASMIVQNALFAVPRAPNYSDPLDVVLTYHAQNQSTLAVTSGLEAVNMASSTRGPDLLVFNPRHPSVSCPRAS